MASSSTFFDNILGIHFLPDDGHIVAPVVNQEGQQNVSNKKWIFTRPRSSTLQLGDVKNQTQSLKLSAGQLPYRRWAYPTRDRQAGRRLLSNRRPPLPRMNGRNRQRITSISFRARCLSSICALRACTSQSAVDGTIKRL